MAQLTDILNSIWDIQEYQTSIRAVGVPERENGNIHIDVVTELYEQEDRRDFGRMLQVLGECYEGPEQIRFHQYTPETYERWHPFS